MKSRWTLVTMFVVAVLGMNATTAVGQSALILNVPDWNQPGPGGYASWCSPTSGGNLLGYWEDVMGCVGLTDRAAMPAGPAYANTPGTYQQGLYQDGQIEIGFFMGTNGWANPATQFPPNTFFGTALPQIGPGLLAYATSGWVDPATGITKVNYGLAPHNMGPGSMGIDTVFGQAAWTNYTTEIMALRPALVSWTTWVGTPTGIQHTINGQTVDEFTFGATDPHTVVGVGFIDKNPAAFGQELVQGAGDEWIIAQDNWGNTPQYVAVPFSAQWLQNDYVYNVPEPTTMVLLAVGLVGLVHRRRTSR